ncbi:MAG: succinylglutamate desuccinylase/aspartoacylase family protein [Gemmatimonadota bacterium]
MAANTDTLDRVLGRFGPRGGAPTLVVVSGLHGNEPAGVRAAQRVRETLARSATELQGELILLLGNVSALQDGRRYVERDLNRAWTAGQIDRLLHTGGTGVEDREQRDLLAALESILSEARGEVFLLDLHTTSADGAAFSTVGDTLRNRELALALPVPLVLGLEELVEGTLHDYMGARGAITVAFESGQHGEPRAVDRAEAAIWIMLAATGVARRETLPAYGDAVELLSGDSEGLPRAVEMRYRHPVAPEDEFRMKAGYRRNGPDPHAAVSGPGERWVLRRPGVPADLALDLRRCPPYGARPVGALAAGHPASPHRARLADRESTRGPLVRPSDPAPAGLPQRGGGGSDPGGATARSGLTCAVATRWRSRWGSWWRSSRSVGSPWRTGLPGTTSRPRRRLP